jgi:hypothetical protein
MFVKRERMITRGVASRKEHDMASRKQDGDKHKNKRADEDMEADDRIGAACRTEGPAKRVRGKPWRDEPGEPAAQQTAARKLS